MKVVKGIVVVGTFLLLSTACTNEGSGEKQNMSNEQRIEDARQAIKAQREQLLDTKGPLDPTLAENMISMYITFVQNNPADKDAQEFLFQAASVAISKQEYERSLRLYQQAIENYPDEKRSPDALFMKAFVLQNHMDKLGAAEEAYLKLIDLYPRHDLSLEARAAIKTLHMSDEELIEHFEKMNGIE
jgi:tetratricopeptide (TPR) repeat protein